MPCFYLLMAFCVVLGAFYAYGGYLHSKKSKIGVVKLVGSGKFNVDVVGESNYQHSLNQICGGRDEFGHDQLCEALLIHEDENPYDNMAIRVDIAERTVGYLNRQTARQFRKKMMRMGHEGAHAICYAKIRGGWDRGDGDTGQYGVKLDLMI